ncbi:hypothetical protein D9M73_117900 [compost metagenome]
MQVAEGDDAVRVIADIRRHHRISTEETARAVIEDLRGPGRDMAGDAETAARHRHHFGVGAQRDDADAIDPVIIHPPVERTAIEAGLQISDDQGGRVDLVRTDPQIVRQQRIAGDGNIAIDRDSVEQATRRRIESGHARSAGGERHDDMVGIHPRQPRRVELLNLRLAKAQHGGRHDIIDGWRREFSIEHDARRHIAPAQIGGDRAGGQQLRIDRELPKTALGKVEQALGIQRQRIGAQRPRQRHAPLIERGGERDLHARRGQPGERIGRARLRLGRAAGIQARIGEAAHGEGAAVRGQRQIGEGRAAQRAGRLALPRLPATLAANAEIERGLQPAHAGDHAGCRGNQMRIEVQPVCIGHGVELEGQPIAARNTAPGQRRDAGGHLRAPLGNVGRAVDLEDVDRPRHRLREHHPRDRQSPDINVQIGQNRRIGVGRHRLERRGALHRHQRRLRRAHVNMVVQIGERPPIHRDARRGQEHALGIADAHIGQHHCAVQRTFDPPDLDVEARRRGVPAQ